MSAAPVTRRAAAEIEGQAALYRIGNHSIHQFWHLFAAHFRHVLLAPQRRPDSGRVAWTWREDVEPRPVTATELTEVRRRLSEANRSLARGFGDLEPGEESDSASGAEKLEGQVRVAVSEMVAQLVAQRDATLSTFVCRTDAGLMLHSWGASSAAKSFFPDAQNGGISGGVVIGRSRPAGVTVALESSQGTVLMRTQSEGDGVFHFANIAPGNYRVRVVERSEFPTDGIAVTMERESITGLELRGVSTDSPAEIAHAASTSERPLPWYQRKWIAVVCLLGALGIGGCIWNSSRTSSEQVSKKKDSGWQSASGPLPGSDGKNVARDDRKIGTDGAFSSLSNSLPPPKLVPQVHPSRDSGGKNVEEGGFHETPDSNGDHAGSEKKNQNPDVATKENPRSASPGLTKQASSLPQLSPGKSPEGKPADAETANADLGEGDERHPSADKTAGASHRPPDKKRPNRLNANPSSTEESSPTPSPSGSGVETNPDLPIDGSSSSPNGTAAKLPGKKGSSSSRENAASPSAAVDGTSDARESPESAAKNNAPVSSNQAEPGRKSPASPGTTANGMSRPANDGRLAMSDVPLTSDEPVSPNSADQKATPKTNPSRKSPVPKPNAGPQPDKSTTTGDDAKEVESSSPSSNKIAKPSGSSSVKYPVPAKPASTATTSGADAPVDPADSTPAPSDESPGANPSRRAKPAKKSGPVPSSQSQLEEKPEGITEHPETNPPLVTSVARINSDDLNLVQTGRIRATAWKARLVQDLIIPTRPLTAREEEQVTVLQQKLRQERTAQMPQMFQHPRMKSGVTLEFGGDGLPGADSPQWRDDSGREIAGSTAQGRMAGLEWEGMAPPPGSLYVLRSADGKMLAQAEIDQTGLLVLKTVPHMTVHYWIGIATGSTTDSAPLALEWRQSSGEAIPTSWSRDEAWLAGKGRRIEIPLDETTARTGHYGISLIDPHSGWALTGDVVLQ